MDETTPPEHLNPLQRFGRDIRQVRLARKLTQKHLGKATGYSEGYVSKVESGTLLPRPSEKFAKGCDTVFGTGELFAGLLRRIDEGDHPSWFVPHLNLERKASRILDYSASLVMGILQTEAYARAVFRASHPREDADLIEGRVAARLRRRELFELDAPPLLWVILHEACLRTVVGDAEILAGQLEYLLKAVTSPHIDLQVLPFSAGAPGAHTRPFTLLTFEKHPTVLYADGPQGGKLYDSPATVALHYDSYDRLRAHALSPGGSLALIKSLVKEYRS
ncbi:helix-turn-helix domain-containing protein [Streptomyces inhibens]|uniref:helix-turn-helix domain-containing protein n=1 Tax=Streptomyces inhibens TaxID=2293571 RepID=UPI001EE75BF8|nr:helix-turn-helix transcriptional regulator [Streptomyces inhibens]UKY50110.1 helix-turn-helix transcriptional regulator [Streptomyces inhibens]